MSTHASDPAPDSTPKRFKPSQFVIAIGIFMAVFTVVSGVVPLITEWHDDSPIARETFWGIPGPFQIAFYTVVPALIVWGAFQFAARVDNWERGGPDRRRTSTRTIKRRLADF